MCNTIRTSRSASARLRRAGIGRPLWSWCWAVGGSNGARLWARTRAGGGRIAFVAGPVLVHTGGTDYFCELIELGYVDVVLAGNALAVHDIECALSGTSLGIELRTGHPVEHGHRNHMRAINTIRRAGSIAKAVASGVLKSGIMHACHVHGVRYILAGSIRDDGPLPETMMDLVAAQDEYTKALAGVDVVVMLSSMLHSIGVGNMLPSWVRVVCVDINPAVVTKLSDRGSAQTLGVVTDVGLFLHRLAEALLAGEGRAALQRALDELPTEFKIAVILCDVEEFSYEEIAQMMGCPIGTVMSRLFYARQKLKDLLARYHLEGGLAKERRARLARELRIPMNALRIRVYRVRQALGGRYTVITAVGRGGNASIFGAFDGRGNKVAIKVLHPELSVSVAADRFLREIEYAARLDHPRIARVLDSGETEYLLWYVMPYVAGETLRLALRREPTLPVDRAVRIGVEVLEALAHAHEQGVAHRDIKPDNIVCGPHGAVLVDLGIARAIAQSGDDRVTRSGFVVGTEQYMSPEQAAGAPDVDGRTDLYSIGVVLFEMLAGRPPFSSPSAAAVLDMHQRAPPPDVRQFRIDLPPALADVIGRALAKAPADRWQTAAEMRAALLPFTLPA